MFSVFLFCSRGARRALVHTHRRRLSRSSLRSFARSLPAMRLAVLLLVCLTGVAKPETPAPASSKAHAHAKGDGPYTPIGAMLDSVKKASFFALLKKMRSNKNAELPEAQKNATRRAQNAEMQKLLGDEVYAKYRAVRVSNTKAAKAAGTGGVPGASTHHHHPGSASTTHAKKPQSSTATHTAAAASAPSPGAAPKKKKPSSSSGAAAPASAPAAATSSTSAASAALAKKKKKPATPTSSYAKHA